MYYHCGLTAEVNQSRGSSTHTRPRRTARPILLGCSKTPQRSWKPLGHLASLCYRVRRSSLIRLTLSRHPCLAHATNANALRQLRGEVNFCGFCVGCEILNSYACPIFSTLILLAYCFHISQDALTELKTPCAHSKICYRFRRMRPCTCES